MECALLGLDIGQLTITSISLKRGRQPGGYIDGRRHCFRRPIDLATELTIAWLANPNTNASSEDVPAFLQGMHRAVIGLSAALVEHPATESEYTPAVTVRRSLSSKDHIISLIDGKPYKTLRRHLSGNGLTPEQYRERYNLKPDYPMVSECYSQVRRDMAKKIGLGRKSGTKVAAKSSKATPKPAAKPRGRQRKDSA